MKTYLSIATALAFPLLAAAQNTAVPSINYPRLSTLRVETRQRRHDIRVVAMCLQRHYVDDDQYCRRSGSDELWRAGDLRLRSARQPRSKVRATRRRAWRVRRHHGDARVSRR